MALTVEYPLCTNCVVTTSGNCGNHETVKIVPESISDLALRTAVHLIEIQTTIIERLQEELKLKNED